MRLPDERGAPAVPPVRDGERRGLPRRRGCKPREDGLVNSCGPGPRGRQRPDRPVPFHILWTPRGGSSQNRRENPEAGSPWSAPRVTPARAPCPRESFHPARRGRRRARSWTWGGRGEGADTQASSVVGPSPARGVRGAGRCPSRRHPCGDAPGRRRRWVGRGGQCTSFLGPPGKLVTAPGRSAPGSAMRLPWFWGAVLSPLCVVGSSSFSPCGRRHRHLGRPRSASILHGARPSRAGSWGPPESPAPRPASLLPEQRGR